MVDKIVILGAGGFGREVLWLIEEINNFCPCYDVLGFIDDDKSMQNKMINNYPVLGTTDYLRNIKEKLGVVITIGSSTIRKKVYEKIMNYKNIWFPTIIAPDVKYADNVKIGQGCILCYSTIVTVNITLGNFVIANLDCTIGHDTIINDFVTLYPSVNISGNVNIGKCSEIGTGTQIIQGKHIGESTIIGAGSVVIRDIPSNCTALGIPAKPIKQLINNSN